MGGVDLGLRVGDRLLRVEVLLIEDVRPVVVLFDLRLEPLRLRGLGGEIVLR